MERIGLRLKKTFAYKGCKIAATKKSFVLFFFFICLLCLNVFLSPLPKILCPNFLDFWSPWEKVMERRVLRFEIFYYKWCKIAAQIFFFFFAKFALFAGIFGIGATICQEMLCLPYAGF